MLTIEKLLFSILFISCPSFCSTDLTPSKIQNPLLLKSIFSKVEVALGKLCVIGIGMIISGKKKSPALRLVIVTNSAQLKGQHVLGVSQCWLEERLYQLCLHRKHTSDLGGERVAPALFLSA